MPSGSRIPMKIEGVDGDLRSNRLDLPNFKKEEALEEESARRLLRQRPRNSDLKIQKKMQDLEVLPPTIAYTLLKDIPDYEISVEDPDVDIRLPVSRDFLVHLYGGNSQRVFPTLSSENLQKMRNDGFVLDQWACMTSALNPYLPSLPGISGLFFALREIEDDLSPVQYWKLGVCRVFAFLEAKKWLYVGHYEFSYGKTLTPDEWKNLSFEVQKDWTKQICSKNQRRRDKRIRIYLRNRPGYNRQFSAKEYLELMASKEDREVTPEQVEEAFRRGEEAIIAWKMKCVNYEEEFQGKLAKEFPIWSPSVKKKAGGRKVNKVDSDDESDNPSEAGKVPSKTKGKKRMAIPNTIGSDSNDTRPKKIAKKTPKRPLNSHDSDSEVEVLSYAPKGTKTRPRSS